MCKLFKILTSLDRFIDIGSTVLSQNAVFKKPEVGGFYPQGGPEDPFPSLVDGRCCEDKFQMCADPNQRDRSHTYSALNPFTCNIRICLTIVLFPDSPAPKTKKKGRKERPLKHLESKPASKDNHEIQDGSLNVQDL